MPSNRQSGQTLAEYLHAELEKEIVSGSYKPGDRLDEQEIALRYGVSRTPVREAFRLLGADNMVDMKSRQGVVVRKIGVTTLLEMFQVMAELEGLCARQAARRISQKQRDDLMQAHEKLEKAAAAECDVETFYAINKEFHELIYDAAKNTYLADQTRQLRNRVAPFRRQVTGRPHRYEKTIREHARILQAIFEHNDEEAHSAMRDHLNLLGDDLTDFIAAYQ